MSHTVYTEETANSNYDRLLNEYGDYKTQTSTEYNFEKKIKEIKNFVNSLNKSPWHWAEDLMHLVENLLDEVTTHEISETSLQEAMGDLLKQVGGEKEGHGFAPSTALAYETCKSAPREVNKCCAIS